MATPPVGYAVRMIVDAAPEPKTSTQQLEAVLDELRFVTPRERALLDRVHYGDSPLNDAEKPELETLQRESEAKRAGSASQTVLPNRNLID